MSVVEDAMRAMLAYAAPFAERKDFAALRRLLDGIHVESEAKAKHMVEASYAESLAGRYRNARTAALMAYTLRPKAPDTRQQLAARLRTFNEVGLLQSLIQDSGPLDRIPIPLLLGFAAQMSYLNLQEAALRFLDEARRGDPGYPPTLMSRGQVLTYLGRLDEAAAEFERCIRIAPRIGQAHWFLSHVTKATAEKNHVVRLRAELGRVAAGSADEVSLAFALHKELDDLGEYDQAWQALVRACAAKRASLTYSASDSVRLVDALVGMPVQSQIATSAVTGPAPIFIVGMHRSGTTLLEQLLDASPDVRGVGELYDFTCAMRYAADHHCRGVIDTGIVARAAQVDFADVGRRYREGMAWRLGRERYFTDKLPSNFLNIGFICQALPDAKILHMVRDPMETCFSNLRELFSDANPYSYDQQELACFYGQYRRLMRHWHASYPGRILDVQYGALTQDPEAVMRSVAEFCGLEFIETMRDPRSSNRAVATASAVQVRQGVVRRETPKWAAYARYLQPLQSALGGLTEEAARPL